MLSQQEISDHIEIQQLMIRYANAIDKRQWDRLDSVFTPDAFIDYSAMAGGKKGDYPFIKQWLSEALGHFRSYQHLIGNTEVQIDGDRATSLTACHNPMIISLPPMGKSAVFIGVWYEDELLRTPAGWRISKRSEKPCYQHNTPFLMKLGQWFLSRQAKS